MSDFAGSDFRAGFASRLDDAARALAMAFADVEEGFAPRDLKARAGGKPQPAPDPDAMDGPVAFSPQPVGARFQAPPASDPAPAPFTIVPDGLDDPVGMARAAGYTEGFRDGHQQGEMERERDQAMLRALGAALKSAERVDRTLVAAQLRQTVLYLVSRIVGDAGVAPDLLARRIEAATDMIADSAETAALRVNPDDLPLLDGLLPATLDAMGDATIDRGSFVLESAATIVEDGPDLWLEQLAQAIDRVGVPEPRD